MAETNLGRVAIVPKGTYSASVQYYYLDLVYYQGSSYLVHTQPTIGTLPTDTNYFYLAAEGAEVEMRYDSITDYIQWKLITDVTWNNLIQPADFTPTIVQTTGTSTTDVMSQKAVTDNFFVKGSEVIFFTDKNNTSKCFQYNSANFGSLYVPSVYFQANNITRVISNSGTILTIPDTSVYFICLNIDTGLVSLVRYDGFNTLAANVKVVGHINNTSKKVVINGDVLIDGAINGLRNPDIGSLQYYVDNYDVVLLPAKTMTLTSTLIIPSGKTIIGVPGKSIIKAGASLATLISISEVSDVSISGVKIMGVAANTPLGGLHNAPAAGVVDSFADAIAETNAGTKIGLYLYKSERINISNCEICNFDKYGLQTILCGKSYEYGIKVTDNYIHDCYCGIKTEQEAEYSTYIGNSITKNQIALYVNSGNNLFVNNHIDKNRVGLVMSNGLNDSHGSFGNCSFNHNSLYGIALNELSLGEVFTSCQIWYAHIYLKNSKGVLFNGGEIANSNVYADGNFSTGGTSMICNTIFQDGSVIYQNYNGNASNLKLRNNWYMGGGDSAAINN